MAWALTQSGFSSQLVQAMAGTGGRLGFLAASIVAFTVLGSILEGIPAIVLFGPLLFPAARAIGVYEVHHAMVVILAWGSDCSRRRSASAFTRPARSGAFGGSGPMAERS